MAANGDTANKVGSYALAIAARHHRVPMYVVAPAATINLRIASGAEIAIEERPARELKEMNGLCAQKRLQSATRLLRLQASQLRQMSRPSGIRHSTSCRPI